MVAKKELSLLPQQENVNTFSAHILRWLTSVGRVVIVFTELIVIGAFLSRFWLDRKNSDLSDIVRQQKAILETTQDFENQYALLQQKLNVIKNYNSAPVEYGQKIISLVNSTPKDIIFSNINLSKDNSNNISTNLSLIAFQENSIVNFITNLSLNPDIQKIDIQKIEKKPRENRYLINLSVTFIPSKKT